MLQVLKCNEIRLLEEQTIQKKDSSVERLMKSAGKAVAEETMRLFSPRTTLVICGPGNNGGDGYAAASLLLKKGWPVKIAAYKPPGTAAARHYSSLWKGKTIPFNLKALEGIELVIDGLFGIGAGRILEDRLKSLFETINSKNIPILAIDIPSGIQSDTGAVLGAALKCQFTVTFGAYKPGHLLLPGQSYCGKIIEKDIGLGSFKEATLCVNDPLFWKTYYLLPSCFDHKYTRGHGLILGGQSTGATRLAMIAARRSGIGLVTIASFPESLFVYASSSFGHLTHMIKSGRDWEKELNTRTINAILVGPGAPPDAITAECTKKALLRKLPCIVDAGALTAFQESPASLFKLLHEKVVLTPHEGEFERLFSFKGDKITKAQKAAKMSQAVIVLKGADTVIAHPSGRCFIQEEGCPFLATGGTGDILSGFILSFAAQGMPVFEASAMAVWIHNEAAKLHGMGLIAEDLPAYCRAVMHTLFMEP
jgi:NAD(P)H-hydrate epimerase